VYVQARARVCACALPLCAGKSSVLQAILQTMRLTKGEMHVGGTVSYVPQTPWVQNLSIRDNILFGLPYDEEKYRKVQGWGGGLCGWGREHARARCAGCKGE